MFCSHCGTLNEDTACFCGGCGARIAAEQPVYQPPVFRQPFYQGWPSNPYWQPSQAAPQPKLPGRGLGIAGLFLSLQALIFGSVWVGSVVFAALGIVFSVLSLAKAEKAGMSNGLALGGLVCGVVGLVIVAAYGILGMEMFSAIPDVGLEYSVYM